MTTTMTTNADTDTEHATTSPNDPPVGSAVQLRHNLTTDYGAADPDAGLHGSIVGRDPFGGYQIKTGAGHVRIRSRGDFIVTALPPARADEALQGLSTGDATAAPALRLVMAPPLLAINSPTNPRRRHGLSIDSLRALADNIAAVGIGQPILVRPLPASRVHETSGMDPRPAYEIIAGERRWRAAQMAELAVIPMFLRPMSDEAVLEMQLIENIEREDLDPMEEAEGFALLRDKLGYSVEQIAEKMGKGRGASYVRKRMKLLDLTPEAREAMYDGTLQLSTGLAVAHYPADVQPKAVALIKSMARTVQGSDGSKTTAPAPFREVASALYKRFNLVLAQAGFDTTDPVLVMTAGACTTCPKRTGHTPELFDDAPQAADSCTDAACWDAKKAAHVQIIRVDAEARGLTVMDPADADKVVRQPRSNHAEGYTPLNQVVHTEAGDDGKERAVTVADLLRAQGRKAPKATVIIHPHTCQALEVVPNAVADQLISAHAKQHTAAAADAQDAAAQGATNSAAQAHAGTEPEQPADPAIQAMRALRRPDVLRAVMYRLFDSVRVRARSPADLLLIAEQFIAHHEAPFSYLEEYLGWEDMTQDEDPEDYLRNKLAALDADQLAQVVTMAAMEAALTFFGGRYGAEAEAADYLTEQGIDILAVRDKVADDQARNSELAEFLNGDAGIDEIGATADGTGTDMGTDADAAEEGEAA